MEKKIDWTEIAKSMEMGTQKDSEAHESERIWRTSARLGERKRQATPKADFGVALARMKERIREEEDSNRFDLKEVSLFSRRQLRYVASVTILMMLSFVAYMMLEKGQGNSGLQVEHNQQAVPKKLSLSDGSEVMLAGSSQLSYPTEFEGNTRKVRLEGKAFFEVAHNERKPFLIETDQSFVKVLGTSFNLEDSENEVNLKVETGRVAFSDKSSKKSFIVTAGESARFVAADNTLYKQLATTDKYGNISRMRWTDERVYFDNVPLEQIAKFVANWKNIEFDWKVGAEIKSISRKTSIPVDASLSKALGNMLNGTDIKFHSSDGKVILKQKD